MSMTGLNKVTMQVMSPDLNDGSWHDVSLTQIGKQITLVVDDCRFLGASNLSSCRQVSLTPDDDERLNIVAPVQIGGVAPLSNGQQYPPAVPTTGLNGCVRNLMVCFCFSHTSKIYGQRNQLAAFR